MSENAYPKIIAVDFDGTLCENKWPSIGAPNEKVLNYISKQQDEGIDRVMVGYWEIGRSYPSYKYFKLMCEMFNVSADWLMGFSDEMYREEKF